MWKTLLRPPTLLHPPWISQANRQPAMYRKWTPGVVVAEAEGAGQEEAVEEVEAAVKAEAGAEEGPPQKIDITFPKSGPTCHRLNAMRFIRNVVRSARLMPSAQRAQTRDPLLHQASPLLQVRQQKVKEWEARCLAGQLVQWTRLSHHIGAPMRHLQGQWLSCRHRASLL